MIIQVLHLFVLVELIIANNVTIDYYVNLITTMEERARYFQLPRDARQYFAAGETYDFGNYDYIVIGAGSAGAVVANRLSEKVGWRVLLLEAGSFENDFTDIPNMYFPIEFTEYNWAHRSIPQTTACLGMVNRICPYARGKAVGGTSVINGLVYSRGNPHDFDRWEAEGNPGWSFADVLPYFKKSEHATIPNGDVGYHGYGGPLNVEYRQPYSPHLYAFLEANRELGREILDYNGRNQLGVSPVQVNTINGRRDSTGKAFINPVLHRPNLKVMIKSYVTKILINEHKTAYGVEFTHNGILFVAKAKHEVILSAGALSSPQILMLSGVGPKKHLREHGIPVIANLAVGNHLIDHPTFYGLAFETNYTEPIRSLRSYVKDYLNGVGALTMPGNNQGLGFFQTRYAEHPDVPDLEIMIVPANSTNEFSQRSFMFTDETADALWGNSDPTRTFILYIIALHAKSEGTVRLKSGNPFDYPEIDSRFLSDPLNIDISTLYEGIQLAFEMMTTNAFRRLNTQLAVKPLPACRMHEFLSRDYWYCAIRQATMNIYHPGGTCKMGPDPAKGAVVNHELKVHGIKNLRVADTSVFPFSLSGHPNAPAILVGEIVSDLIKKDLDFSFDEFSYFTHNYF